MEESRKALRQKYTYALELDIEPHEGVFPFERGNTIGRFPCRLERELRRCFSSHRES